MLTATHLPPQKLQWKRLGMDNKHSAHGEKEDSLQTVSPIQLVCPACFSGLASLDWYYAYERFLNEECVCLKCELAVKSCAFYTDPPWRELFKSWFVPFSHLVKVTCWIEHVSELSAIFAHS